MAIEAGQQLLHYRLIEKIGEGGMGVVWKAVDSTLDREVAIKILPDAFSKDADRLARFEREAKLLASLNNPQIAAIYGLHEVDGYRFLAMELIVGEDLSQRLERGPLGLDEALDVAEQIALGVEAAHDNGVIHRDLKPANVRLTPEGKVKVLDFGLAKAFSPEPMSEAATGTLSPTVTSAGTIAGMILGTARYMSPEQARGKPVDRRTDVWAFGCVLYEMLTGRAAFEGETITDILAALVYVEPDFAKLPPSTPAGIRRLLRRCLRKDVSERLRDIGDARLEIVEARSEDPVASAKNDSPTRAVSYRTAGLLALAGVLIGLAMVGSTGRCNTSQSSVLLGGVAHGTIGKARPVRCAEGRPVAKMETGRVSQRHRSRAWEARRIGSRRCVVKRRDPARHPKALSMVAYSVGARRSIPRDCRWYLDARDRVAN